MTHLDKENGRINIITELMEAKLCIVSMTLLQLKLTIEPSCTYIRGNQQLTQYC